MEDVLSPPYDIITQEYREELYRKSPYNIVRIDFGKEHPNDSERDNKYTRAREFLEEWLNEGILIRNEKPSFYACGMSYQIDGKEKNLIGFLSLVKITKTKPYLEATDSAGAIHRLWQIDEKTDVKRIRKELEDKDIFIADGHHRYETALEFQKEMRMKRPSFSGEEPFNYVLMFLANILDSGITILPAHRLLKKVPADVKARLNEHFDIETVSSDFDISKKMSGKKCVFGFFQNRDHGWYLLTCKEGDLSEVNPSLRSIDVVVLHDLILKKILSAVGVDYEMDVKKVLDKVRSGEFSAAFFLNPTGVEDVEKAALSYVRMPPKSTYFYPKLLTGIVINSFLNG